MPVHNWQELVWWLFTAVVAGFGWHMGNWLAGRIFK
jgi:hypothetical protein